MNDGEPPPASGWRFIDLAGLGVNTLRSYVLTLLVVVIAPLVFLVLAFVAIFAAAALQWLPESGVRYAVIATAFAALVLAGTVLALSVARFHRRPWRSLISPDLRLDWRRLAIGAGIQAALLLIVVYLGHRLTGRPWRVDLTIGVPGLALLLLLIPFQAASEEMLFRGYLTQGLGRVFRSRTVIAIVVGLLFGALHFNAYGVLTVPYLLVLSIVFSAASLRDERLELAIGAHTAMNWLAVATGALGASRAEVEIVWPAFLLLFLHGALFYGLTRLLVRLFCNSAASPQNWEGR